MIWFNTLPHGTKKSFEEIEAELKQKFNPSTAQWHLEQILGQRKQGKKESVSEYCADILRLCHRLNLPKQDWVHNFFKGLLSQLKSCCILKQPANLEAAENLAILKKSVLNRRRKSQV